MEDWTCPGAASRVIPRQGGPNRPGAERPEQACRAWRPEQIQDVRDRTGPGCEGLEAASLLVGMVKAPVIEHRLRKNRRKKRPIMRLTSSNFQRPWKGKTRDGSGTGEMADHLSGLLTSFVPTHRATGANHPAPSFGRPFEKSEKSTYIHARFLLWDLSL